MKTNIRHFPRALLASLMLTVLLAACPGSITSLRAQTQDKVVAVVNGRKITQQEVDESIAAQILPLSEQIYALEKAALENVVSRVILEDAANKRGFSLAELRKQLTNGKIEVSRSEVDQEYAKQASAFGAMSPDEAKERLRLALESESRIKLYREALAELKKNSRIEVFLEEPRISFVGDLETSPSTGVKNAPVTIVEFSDFQCPFCRGAHSMLQQVLRKYGDQVRLVFKHLPLDIHAEAFISARAAFCADEQGRFWQYQDLLFTSEDLSSELLKKMASRVGLDLPRFTSCLGSDVSRNVILKDLREARRFGITATPTFIVNGRLVRGAIGFDEFSTMIERELKSARGGSRIP